MLSNAVVLVENEADDAPNAPLISVAIWAEPDNVPGVTDGLFSNVVTLVEKDELGAVNDPEMLAAVNDLINVALTPNEPDIPAEVNPLPPPASNVVTRVENDADEILNEPDIPTDVNGDANAPDISVAIWDDPDNNPFGNDVINDDVAELVTNPSWVICNELDTVPGVIDTPPDSNEVTLVLKLELGAVNDPLIFVAICSDPDNIPDGNVAVTPIILVPSPTNEPLKIEPVTGCWNVTESCIVIGEFPLRWVNEPVVAVTRLALIVVNVPEPVNIFNALILACAEPVNAFNPDKSPSPAGPWAPVGPAGTCGPWALTVTVWMLGCVTVTLFSTLVTMLILLFDDSSDTVAIM